MRTNKRLWWVIGGCVMGYLFVINYGGSSLLPIIVTMAIFMGGVIADIMYQEVMRVT
jgi:hypothetical protein